MNLSGPIRCKPLADGRHPRPKLFGPGDLIVLAARPKDTAFIVDSWFQSAHRCYGWRSTPADVYQRQMPAILEGLLRRSNVLIAYAKDAESEVVGWIAHEGDRLHYAITARTWRNNGVFTELESKLPAPISSFSHGNETSCSIAHRRGWQYKPFFITE